MGTTEINGTVILKRQYECVLEYYAVGTGFYVAVGRVLRDKMNLTVSLGKLRVPLACLGSWEQGSRAGTPVELS